MATPQQSLQMVLGANGYYPSISCTVYKCNVGGQTILMVWPNYATHHPNGQIVGQIEDIPDFSDWRVCPLQYGFATTVPVVYHAALVQLLAK